MGNLNFGKMILIIGKKPDRSGIGGVTVHVNRLLMLMDKFSLNCEFHDLHFKKDILKVPLRILNSDVIHLHSSNVFLRLGISLFCLFFKKKLIITIHGNLGRYNFFKNKLDSISVKYSYMPILINKNSYSIAKKINKNAKLMSAYIPPIKTKLISTSITNEIKAQKNRSKLIVVTNAFNISFDKNKKETYGISSLLSYFKDKKDYFIVIADPSGNYEKFIFEKFNHLYNLAYFITEKIDFYELLKLSDIYIRNTTTDGDSLSVREALELNVVCYATDVVDRPDKTIVYDSLDNIKLSKSNFIKSQPKKLYDFFIDYKKIYLCE